MHIVVNKKSHRLVTITRLEDISVLQQPLDDCIAYVTPGGAPR